MKNTTDYLKEMENELYCQNENFDNLENLERLAIMERHLGGEDFNHEKANKMTFKNVKSYFGLTTKQINLLK